DLLRLVPDLAVLRALARLILLGAQEAAGIIQHVGNGGFDLLLDRVGRECPRAKAPMLAQEGIPTAAAIDSRPARGASDVALAAFPADEETPQEIFAVVGPADEPGAVAFKTRLRPFPGDGRGDW